ncbi:hypothetical protein PF005_g25941 [Phytophthora fragariae]|uniref:Uncharacterized protein n=2 Tax=Phytophthora fragariae TaxID=53985 RepID=A0A6A3VVF4_9STRA|nr:hypothetical protein PF003_g25648 [Phytophthora fragariae]KAE8923093.1 hypothetical protein PF009_g26649 [Phytophthora fragariae]KAE8961857.1 hypothetical protein PF011_g29592 [Phytophthora fragariae]KAE9061712.1 hypothetical protein PF010_g29713 [Phytophthora fragariae]KAE9079463.1 hypothetical protein PF006_g27516 [Phytophthora fragariae]
MLAPSNIVRQAFQSGRFGGEHNATVRTVRRVPNVASAKIGAIRTEKASASLARFGSLWRTAQAPRSARSGRRRLRPRSHASAPIARRRDQDGDGVGLVRALRRLVQDDAGAKIGAIKQDGDGVGLARALRRRVQDGAGAKIGVIKQDGEGVGLARALRRRVQDGAGAKIGTIRTDEASASIARFGAECNTA